MSGDDDNVVVADVVYVVVNDAAEGGGPPNFSSLLFCMLCSEEFLTWQEAVDHLNSADCVWCKHCRCMLCSEAERDTHRWLHFGEQAVLGSM